MELFDIYIGICMFNLVFNFVYLGIKIYTKCYARYKAIKHFRETTQRINNFNYYLGLGNGFLSCFNSKILTNFLDSLLNSQQPQIIPLCPNTYPYYNPPIFPRYNDFEY